MKKLPLHWQQYPTKIADNIQSFSLIPLQPLLLINDMVVLLLLMTCRIFYFIYFLFASHCELEYTSTLCVRASFTQFSTAKRKKEKKSHSHSEATIALLFAKFNIALHNDNVRTRHTVKCQHHKTIEICIQPTTTGNEAAATNSFRLFVHFFFLPIHNQNECPI